MTAEELDRLLLAYLNRELDAQGVQQLTALIEKRPEVARRLVELADEELLFQNGLKGMEAQDAPKSGLRSARKSGRSRKPSTWGLPAAVAALLLAALTAVLLFRSAAHNSDVATIDSGEATIQRGDRTLPCAKDVRLSSGDRIVSGKNARLQFHYDDGSIVDVNADSELLLRDDGGAKRITLERGAIFVKAAKQPANLAWMIHTSAADATIVGTAFEILVADGKATLRVEEGHVRFGNQQKEVSVSGGNASFAGVGQEPSSPASVTPSEIASWRGGAVAPKFTPPAPPTPPAVAVPLTVPAPFRNFLENPGFESGEESWHGPLHPDDVGSRSIVASPVHSGAKALQIAFDESEYGMMQEVDIHAGETLLVSGWVKTNMSDDRGEARIGIKWQSKTGQFISWVDVGRLSGSRDWTKISNRLTAPANAATATVLLQAGKRLGSSGKIWFDDIEMTEVGK